LVTAKQQGKYIAAGTTLTHVQENHQVDDEEWMGEEKEHTNNERCLWTNHPQLNHPVLLVRNPPDKFLICMGLLNLM
jgi:hypothetical protein